MKIILNAKIVFMLLLFMLAMPVQVQAVNVLFEHRERTYLSRDVVYELNRKVTSAGFLDVHTLTIPLNDPYITIAPVESHRELGLRETTQALLTAAGAIAGTNADFFGMAGTHSLAFGPVISNGQLLSISAEYNQGHNEFATFFLDENNMPILQYIRPRIWFTVAGVEVAQVAAINKVASFQRPIIINRDGMLNTSPLSARFPELRKVMVQDGVIIGVAQHGVVVPENGFVVVMNEYNFFRYRPDFWIGLTAYYSVFSNLNLDLSQIQMAVGGGGLILQHGQIVHDTGTAIAGRHPRTAIGFTPDLQRVILMTVDGRGHSIGATHEDMAMLMLRQGVFNAMHLDGGGSSTMIAQPAGRNTGLQVVNRVSEGSQRAVINAIGIFDRSTPGAISQLVMHPGYRYISRGNTLTVHVYGLDLYRHRIGIHQDQVAFSAYTIDPTGQMMPSAGTWLGNTFIPDRPGSVYIRAHYRGLSASRAYIVRDIIALQFNTDFIFTGGEEIPFVISGLDAGGSSSVLWPERGYVQFRVTPPELGTVQNHVFIPNQVGTGNITALLGSNYVHLPVMVASYYDEVCLLELAAQIPPGELPFLDPLRTAMTAVVPGNAFDFNVFVPGGVRLAYSARQEGPAAILQMSAASGGLFATDRSQWGRFLPDIHMMSSDFVIIQMDANPLNFPSRDEFELFHQALRTLHESGRMVFVVSNVRYSPTLNLRDGIRYIDLGNAGVDTTMWFRVIDGQIWYDF
ncbi:MAG: phosphodiester glycosidase family protein [Defluviitaleaceae bacterium]|nr:phosphodiester glycosidase family protein [Defluviitaleaceae bacterium]